MKNAILSLFISFIAFFPLGCVRNIFEDSSPPGINGDLELSRQLYKEFEGTHVIHTIYIKYDDTTSLSEPLIDPNTGHVTFFVTIESFYVARYGTSRESIRMYQVNKDQKIKEIAKIIKDFKQG